MKKTTALTLELCKLGMTPTSGVKYLNGTFTFTPTDSNWNELEKFGYLHSGKVTSKGLQPLSYEKPVSFKQMEDLLVILLNEYADAMYARKYGVSEKMAEAFSTVHFTAETIDMEMNGTSHITQVVVEPEELNELNEVVEVIEVVEKPEKEVTAKKN